MAKKQPKPDPKDDPDLEFVSTDAMVAELMKRFDIAIFAGMMDRDKSTWESQIAMHGREMQCIALIEMVKFRILRLSENTIRDSQERDLG